MILSTLLTIITIYTRPSYSNIIGVCTPNNNQCATSGTEVEVNPLECTAASTCCGCTAMICGPELCSAITFSGEGSAIASIVEFDGSDAGMDILIDGTKAGQASSLTGFGMTSFLASGEMGFALGTLTTECNEATKCDIVCFGLNSCEGASITVANDAQSFEISGVNGFLDGSAVFAFPSQQPTPFGVSCVAGGACEGADIEIVLEDCLGADYWYVGDIICEGDNACNGASFTFTNNDQYCLMIVNSIQCNAGSNTCKDLKLIQGGPGGVDIINCTCANQNCAGAGMDWLGSPSLACEAVFPNTFAPTQAPTPTQGPTPCPTTQAPVTAAPVTAAPVTAPVTAAPVTAAPVTAPVTAAPVTAVPTPAPTTAAPNAAPVTASPTAVPPVVCVLGQNYEFVGWPAIALGDPHFMMWNGDRHDFMGALLGSGIPDDDRQYYYITRKPDSTTSDLPYNVIGKHTCNCKGTPTSPVTVLDYFTLELLDSNGDIYLLFLRFMDLFFYTPEPVLPGYSTLWEDHYDLATIDFDQDIEIGNIFKIKLIVVWFSVQFGSHFENNNGFLFTLTVDNPLVSAGCTLQMRLSTYTVAVTPPDCYKCHIVGLLGDFDNIPIWGAPARMQGCDGQRMEIISGWETIEERQTAYSSNGLTWLTSECNPGVTQARRRRLQTGSTNDENCVADSAVATAAIEACDNVANIFDSVCPIAAMCQGFLEHCYYDVCVLAGDDVSAVAAFADELLGSVLGIVTSADMIGLFDPALVPAITATPTTAAPTTSIVTADGDDSGSGDSSSDEVHFADFLSGNEIGNDNEGTVHELNISFDKSIVWSVIGFVILNVFAYIGCGIWCFRRKDNNV